MVLIGKTAVADVDVDIEGKPGCIDTAGMGSVRCYTAMTDKNSYPFCVSCNSTIVFGRASAIATATGSLKSVQSENQTVWDVTLLSQF